jgi:hypothetical protein
VPLTVLLVYEPAAKARPVPLARLRAQGLVCEVALHALRQATESAAALVGVDEILSLLKADEADQLQRIIAKLLPELCLNSKTDIVQ